MMKIALNCIGCIVGFLSCLFPLRAAAVDVPRLSPLPVRVMETRVPLSGIWTFNDTARISVPGEWVMQGFEVPKGQEAFYERNFRIPETWAGQRVKLRCNAVYSQSRIFINGKHVGSHLGGFTPFELDVTAAVKPGADNVIRIGVVSETLADSTSNASRYAVHPLGGITRDLYLFALPEVNLSSFHIRTSLDSTYTDATLFADVAVQNESKGSVQGLSLLFDLKDMQGNCVFSEQRRVGIGDTVYAFDVKNPAKWTSETPHLYQLTCKLMRGNTVLHETLRRVGFRQIEVRGNQLFVNNHPIKLRGVCRHEVMPLRGRSLEGDIWYRDVEKFRQGNVNYIRTSHYPPDEALLEACDELGMFVEVEAPFCWAHETKVPDSMKQAVLVNQHVEMVNRDRSHPSVLIWSMGNESNKYDEYFREAARVVKELDPTRPRIFSQWGPDSDHQELEIGNHHYPGPTGPDMYRQAKRPIVFDEFCHLNAYNRLELSADPGLRSKWGELLDAMWNDMYRSTGVLGGAIWAGIDDTFFLPGGRAVGYGTWGPVDGWRREKPEYWGMKKAFSPVRLSLKGNPDKAGKVCFDVENRYNFLNLSDCQIVWKVAGQEGQVNWSLPARQDSIFSLTLPQGVDFTDSLSVDIYAPQGYLVDTYRFALYPEVKEASVQKASKVALKKNEEFWTVSSLSGEYNLDLRKGLIAGNPTLVLLPLNPEGRGIQMLGGGQNFDPYTPVCTNWQARSINSERYPDRLEIVVNGSYKEAEGKLTYLFYTTGEVEVAYDFVVTCPVSPRQIGLAFSLPEEYSRLSWKRKGYWSVYPEDHISALAGTADFQRPDLPVCGLAGPDTVPTVAWSFDQTEAGSNIFRSTKENIYEACLYSPQTKEGLRIISDGSQHVRCWKEKEGFCLLVADYNNAGSDTFLSSHAQKDYRPLKKGDRVQGRVKLQYRYKMD